MSALAHYQYRHLPELLLGRRDNNPLSARPEQSLSARAGGEGGGGDTARAVKVVNVFFYLLGG